MKIIPLLLCSLIGYVWSISIQDNAKSTTQSIVSLDSVLQNLITKAKLDSLNDLTQEECKNLSHTYNVPQDSQNEESYSEEQSCYYAAIQNLKAATAELMCIVLYKIKVGDIARKYRVCGSLIKIFRNQSGWKNLDKF